MAETIRDVIIRISLRMGQHDLRVPKEFTDWAKTVQEAANATATGAATAGKATQQQKQQVETATAATVKFKEAKVEAAKAEGDLAAKQARSKEALQELTAEQRAALQEREENAKAIGTVTQAVEEERAAQVRATVERRRGSGAIRERINYEELQTNRIKQGLELESQRLGVLNQGVASTLQLARGIAFLTASTQEDYQKTLQWLSGIQGVIDLTTGTINAYKTLVDWKKASAAATLAEAAAERTLGGARAFSGAGGFAGAAGGLARGAGAFAGAAAIPLAVAGTIGLAGRQSLLEQVQRDEQLNPIYNPRGFGDRVDPTVGRLANLREQERTFRRFDAQLNRLTPEQQLQALGTSQQLANQQLGQARFDRTGEFELQSLRVTQEFEERRAELQQQRIEGLHDELSSMRSIKEQAEDTLRTEEQRQQSLEARIGRLNPREVAQLKQIADAQKQGQPLTLQQARQLEQLGVGGGLAENRFRQEGQARGAADILAGLGEQRPLDQARKNVEFARNTLAQGIADIQGEIETAQKEQAETNRKLGDTIVQLLQAQQKREDETLRVLQKIAREQERNGVQGALGGVLGLLG